MVQSPGPRPGYQRTPLHPDEAVRAERNFTPYVANGREITITYAAGEALH